jgi:hypothetical protein
MMTAGPAAAPSLRAVLLWAAVLALLAVALSPVLTRSHVEGFTYFTETMAFLVPDAARGDPLWAMNHRYFYLSRPGVVWAMAPLAQLAPGQAYDLLMWIALPVFLTGLVSFARVWSGARWLSCIAALLALPIAVEVNFFHNDNVLATGLSLWALVLVVGGRGAGAVAGAGVLYGLAVLCRLDQVLLGPFFAVLLVLPASSVAGALLRVAAMGLGFVLVHGAFALIDPQAANLILRIAVVAEADALWGRGAGAPLVLAIRDSSAILIALGAGLPAMAAGAVALVASCRSGGARVWARPALLILYPVFIYALTIGKYYDPRGVMVMLPMLAPLAALGIDRWIVGPLLGAPARPGPLRGAVAALILLPVFVPGVPLVERVLPIGRETENAPPTLTGRIWFTGAWRDWQTEGFHRPDAAAAALVRGLLAGGISPVVVVTSAWTDDRRLQHAGVTGGFAPAGPAPGPCAGVAERWEHGDGTVLIHLRAHVPFLPDADVNSAALFLARGADCLRSVPEPARVAVSAHGVDVTRQRPATGLRSRPGGAFRITDDDIAALEDRAAGTLRAQDGAAPGSDVDALAEARLAAVVRRLD